MNTPNNGTATPARMDTDMAPTVTAPTPDEASPLLNFPTDFARPATLPDLCRRVELDLRPGQSDLLRTVCEREGWGVQELLSALVMVFLYRYSGQADIVLGLGPSGVPLRHRLEGSMPFRRLVQQVRDGQGRAAHQAPPPSLERTDGGHRSFAPVFQHRLVLSTGSRPVSVPFNALDTAFSFAWDGASLAGAIEYNTALFEEASARRWALNVATLLESALTASDTSLAELQLLHPSEQAFIMESLDRTAGEYRASAPGVHVLFERQAARTPDAEAVRCGGVSWTYAQLEQRADAIAQHLFQMGAGEGDLIGICTSRSCDMVAAVIGVLKLGAVYVPMDIKYPEARLASIAQEARLRYLLSDERGQGRVAADGLREVLLESIGVQRRDFAPPSLDDESLCHVIFTSGSTGRPKGVMARHRNVMAFLEWIRATYSQQELSVVLCCSSLCFDLTVFELWGPLTTGGAVVVVDNAAALLEQSVPDLTLLNTVPTALRLLVDEGAVPRSVRAVNVCGEPLDGQLVTDLFASYPEVVFYNTYGPTEDTAYSTFFKMTGPVEGDPPIGVPLVHEFGQVMDADGQLAPIGAVGELLIGGAGVARGYLFNPEGTAERFVDGRDYKGRPARVYRSGDFVRLRNSGQIQFVGRRDDQVKLRGFRIDLGDVVSALGQVPGVTDARVMVHKHHAGDVLVAYLSHQDVAAGGQASPELVARVEAQTRALLPAFMVPSFFVLFDRLPLNDNGKVDRHALRQVKFDLMVPTHASQDTQAWTEVESSLAAIWKAVLGVESLARDDDFFLLGGNSLLAVRMMARANRHFDVNLPSQLVFEARTIAQLASRIGEEVASAAVPIERVDADAGVMPTFPQLAMLMEAQKVAFNLCSALRIEGPLDASALKRSFAALVDRHDALRLSFSMGATGPSMQLQDTEVEVLRVVDMPGDAVDILDARVMEAVHEEWCTPFPVHSGPLLRALLIRQSETRHVLVISVHHLASDEWSINIIKNDLAQLYASESAQASALPPLAWRFVDYAAWQGRLHSGPDFGRQLAHWASEFSSLAVEGSFPPGAPNDTSLPTQYLQLTPPEHLTAHLTALTGRHGYVPYVVLMAALQLALSAYSGLKQQLVWSPVSRRTLPELEDAVGMYTNLMAIAAFADPAMTLQEFLASVDRKVALARSNADVSALTVLMQDPGRMPSLPMIGFNFIDLPNEVPWQLAGTQIVQIPLQLEHEADLCAMELTVRTVGSIRSYTVAYNTGAFGADDIQAMAKFMWAAIEQFDHSAGRTVGELLQQSSIDRSAAVSA